VINESVPLITGVHVYL